MIACSEPADKALNDEPYQKVDAATFAELIAQEGTVLIDVRTPQEIQEDGSIANSRNIDIMSDEFIDEVNALDTGAVTYVYCRAGGRSKRAANIMKTGGIKKVVDLEGGITAWKEAGLPVE
jgi:rhodanese-related sulfurtransferase